MNVTISGQQFAEWLAGKQVLSRGNANDRVEVHGSLELTNGSPLSQLRLENFTFLDDIDLSNSKSGSGLEFIGCHFKGRLILDGIVAEGSFLLLESTFEGTSKPDVSLNHAKIGGSLVIENLSGGASDLGPAVSLVSATISGGISLNGKIGKRNQLLYVDGQHAKVGANFEVPGGDVAIERGLFLSGIQIGGSLRLGRGGERLQVGYWVDLENAQIQGNLSIVDIVVFGVLNLRGIRVSGNIDLQRSWGPGRLFMIRERILASNAHVEGDVHLAGVVIGTPRHTPLLTAALELTNAAIGGSLILASTKTVNGGLRLEGNLACRGLRCAGGVSLAGVTVKGDVQLDNSDLPGGLQIVPSGSHRPIVAGHLFLSSVRGRPWVELRGISIKGDLRVIASDLNELRISPGSIGEYGEFEIFPPCVGRLAMRATHVQGSCILAFLQINGTLSDFGIQGLYINNSTIEGDLSFWSSTALDELRREEPDLPLLDPFNFSAAVIGPVSIINSTVNGKLDFSFFKASGPLSLRDTHVKGDVLFSSTRTVPGLSSTSLKEMALHKDAIGPLRRATTCGADFRMLRVDNDLDLTGLSVFQEEDSNPSMRWPFGRPGAIDARQLKVAGELKAYAKIGTKEVYVEVPGQFDLRNLVTDHLEISGHSFPLNRPVPQHEPNHGWRKILRWFYGSNFDVSVSPETQDGLVLSGGQIGSVFIPAIEPEATGRPFPLALDGLRVDSWAIGDSKDGVDREVFRQLLEKDPTFRRSTYRSIEAYLRNHGEEDCADFIYREMWRRERRKAETTERLLSKYLRWITIPVGRAVSSLYCPWLRRLWIWAARSAVALWWWLYGAFLRYGTSPMRLLFVIAILGLLAFPLYRHPTNIEPSLERLGIDLVRDAKSPTDSAEAVPLVRYDVSPAAADWTATDAFALLLRYHIPIVPAALRDEWTMRNDPGAIYDPLLLWPGARPCQPKDSIPAPPPAPSNPTPVRVCEASSAVQFPFAAEDVSGVFMILNYAMWPLLLGFLIRRLLRH